MRSKIPHRMAKADIKRYKRRLLQLLRTQALRRGRVVLSSGRISSYYFDGRLVTLSAQGAYLAANIIIDLIRDRHVSAVGGPTLGADPIVGAVVCLAAEKGMKLNGFIVRKAPKGHGMRRLIEGPGLVKGSRVILVDDVATTGGSLISAKKILDKQGVIVDCVIVILDREEGARENLARVNCHLIPLFTKRDIL